MLRPHVIQWPDSGFGIRIPARFLEQIGVRENDEVEIFCQGDRIVIRKASGRRPDLEADCQEPGKK